MYTPTHFQNSDPQALHQLMREHPLGTLVRQGPSGLDADHLPFELDLSAGPLGTLRAHVARANPLWQEAVVERPVLVVFHGPQAYISPSWYPSKHEAHRQVPTWNYEVVHAHGLLSVCDDERFARGLVARLTRTHEARETLPWKMGEAPPDFVSELLQKIVGLEVRLTRVEGKSKLSQNKEVRDQQGAAEVLDQRGHHALAAAMRPQKPQA